MNKILLSACLLFGFMAFGQGSIESEVGDFHTIKVFDLIEVNLIKSDENKIYIKGRNTHDIKWANKDGILKLRMQLDKKFTGEDTFIEVHYQDIEKIDGNEGAKITCNEIVEQDVIELRAQEGARIMLGMDVGRAEIRAVTGGIVEASGRVEEQSVVINTGGVYEGRSCKSNSAKVKISAGGEAEVYADEKIDIDIKAGGDILVFGNPDKVKKRTFVGGRIKFVD